LIAGLDSSVAVPSAAQLADAKRHGVRIWSGYLATRSGVGILHHWSQAEFARVKQAGLEALAFCSGQDDPAACKQLAASWGVRLCLDVERGIRSDGPWVQPWLNASGAGLYGNAPVFVRRTAPFCVLAAYPGHDPQRTWTTDPHHPRPSSPCGWQWQGTHTEFGCGVDRGWYDDWFAAPGENHWTTLGGSWEDRPAAAQNLDGRLELFAIAANGHLMDLAQSAANGSWWSDWVDLGPPPPTGAAATPVVARNLDGRLEVFVRARDGSLHHRWQQGPGGSLTPHWESLAGSFAQNPGLAQNLDGRLELFALGSDHHIYELAQSAPNGAWQSRWADLGPAPEGAVGPPTVARNLDGRLEVFLRGGDGRLHHRSQQAAGAAFAAQWTALAGLWHQNPIAAQDADGRLELFALGANGHLFLLAQSSANGSWWTAAADLGPPPANGASGSPAVARNADGRIEVFVRGADNKVYHRWQQAPGAALSPHWAQLGGSCRHDPVIARNKDGRLEAFIVGHDKTIEHGWQVAPGQGWA
jgi:hypothetical protein